MTLNLHGDLLEESFTTPEPVPYHAQHPELAPRTHPLARITSTIIINVAKIRFWENDPALTSIDSIQEP